MKITRFTDYSLRVLIYLAIHDDECVTIKEVADAYKISKNHLMKVVQELNIKGYLKATRGKNGGIKLNKNPKQINIGDLVRTFEENSTLVECFGIDNQCVITPACQLKQMLEGAMNSFFTHLELYTLADLTKDSKRKKLNKLLTGE